MRLNNKSTRNLCKSSHTNLLGRSHEPPASFETQLQLNGLGKDQAALLDLISDIQGDGTAGIELPQIIVVGGQSAGKSSTLEAITGLPFPKKAEACTRFATEIRLKHASVEGFAAEIIPDKGRSPEQQAELRKFGKGNRAYNKNTPAATVFEDAHAAIVTPSAPFVLRDKLVVTLAGPNRGHLTLVDLPGLFVNYADGQRSSDIPAIQALVDEYMTNNRSVILAVIAGDEDLGGATIMNLVRKHDPDGLRTIGVVTKPDAATYKELHHRVVQLVQNEIEGNKLRLGWHVVLNPKQSESWTSPEQRSAEEDIFFATNPWSQLRYAQTRIGELRKKLGQHLAAHIANNIPEMRVQIQERVDVAESILNSLGDGTDDRDEMRVDLIRRINASKEVSSNAVNGMYSYFDKAGKQFFPRETPTNNVGEGATTPWENLRARVVCENELFSDDLRLQGHGLPFVSETSTLMTQEPAVITEMEGKKRDYAQRFVKLKIRDLRGTHKPGEISHQVSYHLLNEHATKWEQMSKTHLSKVLIICNQFVGKVLEKLWLPHMRGPLKEQFLDARMDDYRKQAFEHLQYLIGDIGYEVQPYDPEYERRVEEWERKRRPGSWGENSDFDSREYNAELVLERALVLYDVSAIPTQQCIIHECGISAQSLNHHHYIFPPHPVGLIQVHHSTDNHASDIDQCEVFHPKRYCSSRRACFNEPPP